MNNVALWWKYEGRYYHKDFISGVKNLIRWFPVIWKDRDWDHSKIYDVLKFKLQKQAEYIGGRDFHTRAKRDAEVMMTCVRLIDKVQEEYYDAEYMDYHETEHNWLDTDNPEYKQLHTVELSENFDAYFKKYPSTMRKVLANPKSFDYIDKDYKDEKSALAMLIAHANQTKAQALLFKIMNDNIRRWWDQIMKEIQKKIEQYDEIISQGDLSDPLADQILMELDAMIDELEDIVADDLDKLDKQDQDE